MFSKFLFPEELISYLLICAVSLVTTFRFKDNGLFFLFFCLIVLLFLFFLFISLNQCWHNFLKRILLQCILTMIFLPQLSFIFILFSNNLFITSIYFELTFCVAFYILYSHISPGPQGVNNLRSYIYINKHTLGLI